MPILGLQELESFKFLGISDIKGLTLQSMIQVGNPNPQLISIQFPWDSPLAIRNRPTGSMAQVASEEFSMSSLYSALTQGLQEATRPPGAQE